MVKLMFSFIYLCKLHIIKVLFAKKLILLYLLGALKKIFKHFNLHLAHELYYILLMLTIKKNGTNL